MVDADPTALSYRARLTAAAAKYGEQELAERAADLLETGDEQDEFLLYLGGTPARGAIDGSWPRYWAQTWGARALEHYWAPTAGGPVIRGLDHEHWRVRMVCARVCAVQELGYPEKLAVLCADDYWRVREAAARALGAVGEGEHAGVLRGLLDDENRQVRDRAQSALLTMAERLDRPIDDLEG